MQYIVGRKRTCEKCIYVLCFIFAINLTICEKINKFKNTKHIFLSGLMSRSLSESDLSELDGMELTHEAEKSQEALPSSGRREHLPAR